MQILQTSITTVVSIIVLFIIAKCIGHRQISELNVFDYITGITIGSTAAELATEIENPEKPLTAMILYGIFTVALNFLTNKSQAGRRFINGKPSVIFENGKLSRSNMKHAKLDINEFLMMCREAGYFDLSSIDTAVFETNGNLSILPKAEYHPVTPSDMAIVPQGNEQYTELIMDGKIQIENLKRLGYNRAWLQKQIEGLGYDNIEKVFLCLCDSNGQVSIY